MKKNVTNQLEMQQHGFIEKYWKSSQTHGRTFVSVIAYIF